MVLRAIEGCDGSGPSANGTVLGAGFSQKWDVANLTPGTTTTDSERFSGTIIYPTAFAAYYDIYINDQPEEIACGLYIKPDEWGGGDRKPNLMIFKCRTSSSSTWFHLEVSISSRDILVRRNNGNNSDPIISNVLEPRQWNLIELKTKIHDTTGYWYIYVNGILVGSNIDVDTLYLGPFNRFRFGLSDRYASYGDAYLLDLTGAQNNNVLGSFHIQGTFPDANGANSDWTPSANVDHYTLVNEAPPDEADYVESNTADEQDLYNYEDLTGTWDEIFGIQMNTRLFLDSAGSETASIICDSNGTEDSANFTVDSTTIGNAGELAFQRIIELDPDTSNAWDTAGIDAAQFGIKFI